MKLIAGDLVIVKADPAKWGIGKVKGLTPSGNMLVEFGTKDTDTYSTKLFHPDALELAHAYMRV